MKKCGQHWVDEQEPRLTRIAMSEEDAIFYRLKYGHEPLFRIEPEPTTDKDGLPDIKYTLTNIPRPGDIDYD